MHSCVFIHVIAKNLRCLATTYLHSIFFLLKDCFFLKCVNNVHEHMIVSHNSHLFLDQLQRLKYIDRTMFIFKNLFCFIDEKYIYFF